MVIFLILSVFTFGPGSPCPVSPIGPGGPEGPTSPYKKKINSKASTIFCCVVVVYFLKQNVVFVLP